MKPQPRIFVTRKFPGPGLELLQAHYDVTVNKSNKVLSPWQLRRAVKGVDVIVSLLTDKIDATVMDAAGPQLKLIANYAIGFDNIDTKAAVERKIFVTNTPGTLSDAVAEHTIALTLAVARRIAEADRFTRANKYRFWDPELMIGFQLKGKTFGIIGLGRIGADAARIAEGFGMKAIYSDVVRNKKLEKEYKIEFHELETVLKTADVISLHVPLLPTTKHLIDTPQLAMMKETAILINTARGPVINEKALVHALKQKQIWGAGLDVFEHEPQVSRELERLDNVVLTPHIASATKEARDMMSQIVADNVMAVLDKGKPMNQV
jgi:glyoxylate reductase